jgi:CRISPR-associated protein Csx16
MPDGVRLVSFLGTGDYQAARYSWPGAHEQDVETPFVACALARMLRAADVRIACTRAAEERHGTALRTELARAGIEAIRFERLEDGKTSAELWENFSRLSALIAAPGTGAIVLDITHGFRSQPFFAGAVVSFARALEKTDAHMRVVYGAFDAKLADGRTPIWDLTPFVELADWTHAIRQFMTSGDARPLVQRAARLGRALRRDWALAGRRGERPGLDEFAEALRGFGDALATVRAGDLLLARGNAPSAASRLADAAVRLREHIARYAPPLGEVIGEIEAMARALELTQDHLGAEQGRGAMAALAGLYLRLGRFAEAAIALREGWINLYASREACRPGFEDYDEEARARAENRWIRAAQQHLTIARVRNDIEHGGFRRMPEPASAIRAQLEQLVAEFANAQTAADEAPAGTIWFVSRHPGAAEWARRRGIAVQRLVAHLDAGEVNRGDTVIGTLPVHLAAKVCERGARYLNLSLDLPAEARGRELDADELERYGARLEPFSVRPLD